MTYTMLHSAIHGLNSSLSLILAKIFSWRLASRYNLNIDFWKSFLVYLILAGISFILAAAMRGEKLVGWKVALSLSVLSVVVILFATIMKIQLNFLIAEVANIGEIFFYLEIFYDQSLMILSRYYWPYYMVHIIWPLLYGPCHIARIIRPMSYDPYDVGHVMWISYGTYDMDHFITYRPYHIDHMIRSSCDRWWSKFDRKSFSLFKMVD